ncbi:hypothetical protein H8B02_21930 [Bradyrhizobium sp. Pear77]|uniref:hypothetical protein n=1 Tax=Bradyrhizobium altum TaxID=1571202 RepID=UPI001E619307|nr:hypothetical protein [Bradyrhizobium altum]MCC8955991.1 hypothetical protein [Bradyrhizobium altum]
MVNDGPPRTLTDRKTSLGCAILTLDRDVARILQCWRLECRFGRRRRVHMQIGWYFRQVSGTAERRAAPSIHFETSALSALCAFGTRAAREPAGAHDAN